MTVYAVTLLAAAAVFLAVGIAIRRGNTGLIHEYHQQRVADAQKPAYARAFARGLFCLAAALLLSSTLALIGQTWSLAAALAVLFAGLALSVLLLCRVQKRFNGGMF